jgi:3-methyl-2-oxobutanoate hydroxymethyltransferase
MEGGREVAPMIEKVVQSGIPVMGHIGLVPQSVHKLGGYRVQGRHDEGAQQLLEDARAVERAGAFSIVLEAVDPQVATDITAALSIPTIGIGAGRGCDGQVLVISDLAGMLPSSAPKFVKQYATVYETLERAVKQYGAEVRRGEFPEQKHEY